MIYLTDKARDLAAMALSRAIATGTAKACLDAMLSALNPEDIIDPPPEMVAVMLPLPLVEDWARCGGQSVWYVASREALAKREAERDVATEGKPLGGYIGERGDD